MQGLIQLLEDHKVDFRRCLDRIHWGYQSSGQFNVKEATKLASDTTHQPTQKKWNKLWGMRQWPKITLFLWFLMHGRILTWENLRKRGMIGPSKCVTCSKEEEMTGHLLLECEWVSEVWHKGACLL